jgi:hypothetical protein
MSILTLRVELAPSWAVGVAQDGVGVAQDGKDERNGSNGGRWMYNRWWSPDGNVLYFVSDRDGFRCYSSFERVQTTGRLKSVQTG